MTETEDYFAEITPGTWQGWNVNYFGPDGHFVSSDIYTFRWMARLGAKYKLARLRTGPEFVR